MDMNQFIGDGYGLSEPPGHRKRPVLHRFMPAMAVLCSILIGSLCMAAEDQVIGIVKIVKGNASIVRNQQTLPAAVGVKLQVSDELQTGADGSLGVILRDDSVLSLGPNSRLVIDRFLFSPKDEQLGLLVRILRGTMAYLSGVITKLSPGAAKFETPVSTIGIRGTKFAVKVEGGAQ
jgi:hypothetical protein